MFECREKNLKEYIEELEIEENIKKRMLELCEREEEEKQERECYLHNCHMRIDELERTVIELGTELAKEKHYNREYKAEKPSYLKRMLGL